MQKKRQKRLAVIAGLVFSTTGFFQAQANILINEVLYDAPNNDSTEEFVELYNDSCQTIDLTGYQLADNSSSFALSGTIGPGAYFTVAKSATAFQSLFGSSPQLGGFSLALGNSGDYLRLKNGTQVLDEVAWEGGLSGWSVSAKNKSIERVSTLDTGTDSDWAALTVVGTPGQGVFVADCGGNGGGSGSPVLENGVAKTGLQAATGEKLYFTFDVPAGASDLSFAMSGGSGDADLYVQLGSDPTSSSYLCRPYLNGNTESCDFAAPNPGTYHVMLDAYAAFSGVELVASFVEGSTPPSNNELTNGDTVSGLSAAQGGELSFHIAVPVGATDLLVSIAGGTGDADLYLKAGSAPTTASYDCRPYKAGNSESCSVSNPTSTDYYVMLRAYNAFSGVNLSVSFSAPGSGGGGSGGGSGNGFDFNTYYAAAIGKTGAALKAALNQAIQTQVQMTYSEVWTALEYTDEDPNNTNNVILLYSGRSQPKTERAGLINSPDAWNREHVWPKSHGFPSSSQGAYTDINHLRPADSSINSTRGNKDFDWGGTPIGESPENKRDADSFEPANAVKGDVARMVFYMDVRYEGNDSSGVPNLDIVDYTGTQTGDPLLGKLCTLMAWHRQDPVSAWEQRRNNRVYEVQQNRNPFIDNPQWAEDLYGALCP